MYAKRLLLGLAGVVFASSVSAATIGGLDSVNLSPSGAVTGWACNPSNPNSGVVKVLVYRDGRYIGSTQNFLLNRPDRQSQCGGNSWAGWYFTIPDEEFDNTSATWQASVVDGGIETPLPVIGGGSSITASLPTKWQVWYVQPTCYQWWQASGAITTRPGSILDSPSAFWGFGVNVNGTPPLSPVWNWDAGIYTGVNVPAEYRGHMQLGDTRSSGTEYDDTLTGRSMLQLNCTSAGFMLNNFWLDDVTNPVAQYGIVYSLKDDPKLIISDELGNPINTYQNGRINSYAAVRRPFATANTSLVVDAHISVPLSYYQLAQGQVQNQQANIYLNFWDTSSGRQLAYVLGVWTWDSSGNHYYDNPRVDHDGISHYAAQSAYFTGSSYYAIWEAGPYTPGTTFPNARQYKVKVTAATLGNAIAQANSQITQGVSFSTNPADYVLIGAVAGIETGGPSNSIGASVSDMYVYMTR